MIEKEYSMEDVMKGISNIVTQMYKDSWRPDYIVGINRGGLPISVVLSHMIDVTHYCLDVRLRDNKDKQGPESNCWMAEDAFGYLYKPDRDDVYGKGTCQPKMRKNILIVDDINDTGATFKWIKEDWESGCLPGHEGWQDVWNQNVRFAALCEKTHTKFDGVDYYWEEIDTSEQDTWVVFPWENV